MGPGETERLLKQIKGANKTYVPSSESVDVPDVTLDETNVEPFKPEYGIQGVRRANLTSEDHLEASIIANPSLLPENIRPNPEQSTVRQAPISPLKPMQVDEVDVSFYNPGFADGMYPNDVLELKYSKADGGRRDDAEQIGRYREAIDKMATHHLSAEPDERQLSMYAPEYDGDHFGATLSSSTIQRINFKQFEKSPETPNFATQTDSY